MIKTLWLRSDPSFPDYRRDHLASLNSPPMQVSSAQEAARQLCDDPRLTVLLIHDNLGGEEARALNDGLASRVDHLEIILLSQAGKFPTPLAPTMDRFAIAPWIVGEELGDHGFQMVLEQASIKADSARELRRLRLEAIREYGFVGPSESTRLLTDAIIRGAKSPDPLLISGPPGTGHRDVATAIHRLGQHMGSGPLRMVESSIGAMEDGLGVVFGTASPAGARDDGTAGLIHRATNGTLVFMDVDASTPALQARLSEYIATGQFNRVGSLRAENHQCRILATTTDDLVRLAEREIFRQDLLNEFASDPIELAPLSAHAEDVPEIATLHADRVLERHGHHLLGGCFLREALDWLRQAKWPGDRKGLAHFVEWLLLTDGLKREHPYTARDVREQFEVWVEAAIAAPQDPRALAPMHFCHEYAMDYARASRELQYAYLTIAKRHHSKKEIAEKFDRSPRWVEMEIKTLATVFLEEGIRTGEELQRDQIWSKRMVAGYDSSSDGSSSSGDDR